jgi:RNA methyltransferase, TrmH family
VYTPDAAATPRWASLRQRLRSSGVREALLSPAVFAALSQVDTPQGVLGVASRPAPASPAMLRDPQTLLVVLDGIQDPGNVGAILRTAAATGATAAATVASAADPFSPKALRASAGAVFYLPLLHFATAADAAAAVIQTGLRLYVADPRGRKLDVEVSLARPVALVFGSEGAGADPAWLRAGAETVRIPLMGAVESLNVAAAAAVLLYRAAGQMSPAP